MPDDADARSELVETYYAAVGRRDLVVLEALWSDDIRWSSPASIPGGGIRIGRSAVLEGVKALFAAWPEIDVRLDRVQLDGRGASVQGRYETPNGIEVPFRDQLVLREDRIAAVRSSYDAGSLARALRAPRNPS